jgi:hypothetical protein
MYDPALGRFNGVDPLSDKQANQSAYNFVWNNPSGLIDPDGKWPGLPYGAGYVSPRVVQWAQQAESRSMQAMFQRMQPFNYDQYIVNKIQGQMSDALSRHVAHWAGKQSSHQTGGGVGAQGSFERMFYSIVPNLIPVIPGVVHGIMEGRNGNYLSAAANFAGAIGEGYALTSAVRGASTISNANYSGVAQKAWNTVPNGSYYSVAYQVTLPSNMYPGVSAYRHFQYSNTILSQTMATDSYFNSYMTDVLKISIPRSASTGSITGFQPEGWVWHHDYAPGGTMQLVPKYQHPNTFGGSIFWPTLHPNGMGGMSNWGGGYPR